MFSPYFRQSNYVGNFTFCINFFTFLFQGKIYPWQTTTTPCHFTEVELGSEMCSEMCTLSMALPAFKRLLRVTKNQSSEQHRKIRKKNKFFPLSQIGLMMWLLLLSEHFYLPISSTASASRRDKGAERAFKHARSFLHAFLSLFSQSKLGGKNNFSRSLGVGLRAVSFVTPSECSSPFSGMEASSERKWIFFSAHLIVKLSIHENFLGFISQPSWIM